MRSYSHEDTTIIVSIEVDLTRVVKKMDKSGGGHGDYLVVSD